MEQKEINRRIAMAMIQQCAIVWELYVTKPKRNGKYTIDDIIHGMYDMKEKCKASKTGLLSYRCKAGCYDVFKNKLLAIKDTVGFSDKDHTITIKIRTSETNPDLAFGCSYPMESVFLMTRTFCRINGCPTLLNKIVFGYDRNGKYSTIQPSKPIKEKAVRIRTRNPQFGLTPDVIANINAALAKFNAA